FLENLQEQLCLYRDSLVTLFADGVIGELAITGADPFFLEGTDLTLCLRLKQPGIFGKKADEWLAQAKKKYPTLIERDFHYRGHKVQARYTEGREVSSFVVQQGDFIVYSNSHRAIRAVLDAATAKAPALHDAADYRYMTAILPPSDAADTGYF